jgi:tellurite methyltransferase
MQRDALDFITDPEGEWMALLACGHTQHVRHRPPLVERPWTQTQAGRRQMVGTQFNCVKCVSMEAPAGLNEYSATPWFDEISIPAGLRKDHSTKRGVWGRIEVVMGELTYEVTAPFVHEQVLSAGSDGWIPPEAVHHVMPVGAVQFRVHFLR